jgi:hypothetical protein
MTRARAVAAAAGFAAFAVGAAAIVAPGVADLVPVAPALAVGGNDYLLVVPLAAAGVLACVGAVAFVAARGVTEATPPAPEGVPVGEPPGADLDRLLAGRRGVTARFDRETRQHVHRRLRDAAVETVARTDGCSTAAAREQVADGSWTDDASAAAFLQSPPARWTELPGLARGESRFQRGARRTVAAIASLSEGAS